MDVHELTELLLPKEGQPTVGTSVKVDGSSDPLSFLTVFNLSHHRATKTSKDIQQYLLKNMAGENQAKLKTYFEDPNKVH